MARGPQRAPRWQSSEAERMPRNDDAYETAKWRTLWLMVGFAVLVGVGIFTVLRPELEDESQEQSEGSPAPIEANEEPQNGKSLQE